MPSVAGALLAAIIPNVVLAVNTTIPITQKVTIDGVEVYSQSSGHALLNTCTSFARGTVNDDSRPKITVCGSQTKVTVWLLNRCKGYHEYIKEIGTCNSQASSDSCATASPATDEWLQTAQSYKIEQCATR